MFHGFLCREGQRNALTGESIEGNPLRGIWIIDEQDGESMSDKIP